ncbi:hypothetical protein ABBQ38_012212 [Trebouxia sp. C0009 RCD-2024]
MQGWCCTPRLPTQASTVQVGQISGAHLNAVLQFYELLAGGAIAAKACRLWCTGLCGADQRHDHVAARLSACAMDPAVITIWRLMWFVTQPSLSLGDEAHDD